jgi:ribosome-binding factor A
LNLLNTVLIIYDRIMAANNRIKKIGCQIKQELAWIIDRKLKDPKKGFITVTRVRMSPDLRLANVYFSVLGATDDVHAALETLNRGKSFLRNQLRERVQIRFLPELRFYYDDSMEYSERIAYLIEKIHKDESIK